LPNGTSIRSIQMDGKPLALGQRVALGYRGVQDLQVEIVLGDARARITGTAGRFASALVSGDGT
jgi:hypothetical protein